MKKVIKLTESDLINLVRLVLREKDGEEEKKDPLDSIRNLIPQGKKYVKEVRRPAFDWVVEQLQNDNFGDGTNDDLEDLRLKSGEFEEFLDGFAHEMAFYLVRNELDGDAMYDEEIGVTKEYFDRFEMLANQCKEMYENEIREVFESGMSSGGDSNMLNSIAMKIMSSPRVREVEVNMDPSEYEDEFEYADNFFYNLLADHEDEDYYDDLMEYMKDEFSELIFSFYFNS